MTRSDYMARLRAYKDMRDQIDADLAKASARYAATNCPVGKGDTFVARGTLYLVSRIEVESPDVFVVYGVAASNRGRRNSVEVFVGYAAPLRPSANARGDS